MRPEVEHFAELMEEGLRENDYKGGWNDMTIQECLGRMFEELLELMQALARGSPTSVKHEAADVANFLMFIVDNAYGLRHR